MKRFPIVWLSLSVVFFLALSTNSAENKYSAKANEKKATESVQVDFRKINKPFRMAKLNMLWAKAQVRLTEPKLKSLFSDLKIQDKEEIVFKKFKSEGGDGDGLKGDELRKKMIGIMTSYDLLEHFEDIQKKIKQKSQASASGEDHLNKSLFKDKKLNKLWSKAEMSGFTSEELQALKEEFTHHQDKIDQYYSILTDVEGGKTDNIDNAMDYEEMDSFNNVETDNDEENNINKDYLHKANMLRDKHLEIRDGFDKLYRKAAKGPLSKDFVEPKVQALWLTAMKGNFTTQELESLRVELLHYESRLLKLRHLQAEKASNIDKLSAKIAEAGAKTDAESLMDDTIKKHMRKVEKLHSTIENKILTRHTEL